MVKHPTIASETKFRVIRARESSTVKEAIPLISRGAFCIGVKEARGIEAAYWLLYRASMSDLGIFLGYEYGYPKTVAVAMLPSNMFMEHPQIAMVYNEGDPRLFVEVAARMRKWLQEEGYNCALAMRRRNPAAFRRATKHFGEPRDYGTMLLYEF
jgi:hypothetical protein